MIILANLLRKIFVHPGTLIALMAFNAQAGDVIPFNKGAGPNCRPYFQSSLSQKTSGRTPENELISKVIKQGENEQFLFDSISRRDNIPQQNFAREEQTKLEQEIDVLIKNNPKEAAENLLKLVSSELTGFRTRSQAANHLSKTVLTSKQMDQLEQEVLKTYKKSELLTNNKNILDRHNKNLDKIEKDDSQSIFRPLMGEDIGNNTKLFANLSRNYIQVIHSLSLPEALARLDFVKSLIARIMIDISLSRQPTHSHTQIKDMLTDLTVTDRAEFLAATEPLFAMYFKKYPEIKSDVVWRMNYKRRDKRLSPSPLELIKIEDLENAIKRLFTAIESGNTNPLTERLGITDITIELLATGKIKFESSEGPIAQMEKIMERSLHFKHPLRLQERELIHAYLLTINGKFQLNENQSQVLYTLIQKLIMDAIQDGKASEADYLIRDTITIAKVRAVPNVPLMQKLFTNPSLGTSIKSWIEDYLENVQQ